MGYLFLGLAGVLVLVVTVKGAWKKEWPPLVLAGLLALGVWL